MISCLARVACEQESSSSTTAVGGVAHARHRQSLVGARTDAQRGAQCLHVDCMPVTRPTAPGAAGSAWIDSPWGSAWAAISGARRPAAARAGKAQTPGHLLHTAKRPADTEGRREVGRRRRAKQREAQGAAAKTFEQLGKWCTELWPELWTEVPTLARTMLPEPGAGSRPAPRRGRPLTPQLELSSSPGEWGGINRLASRDKEHTGKASQKTPTCTARPETKRAAAARVGTVPPARHRVHRDHGGAISAAAASGAAGPPSGHDAHVFELAESLGGVVCAQVANKGLDVPVRRRGEVVLCCHAAAAPIRARPRRCGRVGQSVTS